jgi:hypothetical protein
MIAGVPLWMVLRHPDRKPAETRRLPAYLRPQRKARTATSPSPAWEPAANAARSRRELVGHGAR